MKEKKIAPTPEGEVSPSVDPVTYEVIRHRLLTITDEQAATLAAVSGSPLVNEASDFNTGLYLADGQVVTMGKTVIFHAASLSRMAVHIIADCEDDPGIAEDDMFIVNSPYKGALHAPDVGILAPIFYDGKRIAWAGVVCHQLDVGGMVPGSFCPQARDVWQESMLITPVKLIDRGHLRSDVWRMIIGMSRLPWKISLDLKGMIAANRVAKQRVAELIDRYGAETVLSVMVGMIELSEKKVRSRLRELPDGIFRARTYLEHDGHQNNLYEIRVTLTKQGEALTFDYSESSPQAPGFVNCTETGLYAGVYAAILPILAYDIPWTSGVFHPVTIVAPEGLIVNARWPAPVSQGPLGAMWLVEQTATEALSKLVACSPKYMQEAQALPKGGADLFNIAGTNQYGERLGVVTLDQLLSGGGAYAHRDGLEVQGHRHITAQKVPNIESIELIAPLLYLYRRFIPDTSGPGRQRGGQSAGTAYILHDVNHVRALIACHGFAVPNALGLFGGYPGACNVHRLYRKTDVRRHLAQGELPVSLSELSGEVDTLGPKPGEIDFGSDDVFEWSPQGGGGWGDPLERPPELVIQDLKNGVITPQTATDIYGVVVGADGRVDDSSREKIRAARRAGARNKKLPTDVDGSEASALIPLGDRLAVIEINGVRYVRCACGFVLSPAKENWKEYAAMTLISAEQLGSLITLDERLEARQYSCPHCGRLHAVEISQKDAPPLWDVELAFHDESRG